LVNSRSKSFVQQQLPNYAIVVVVPADVPTISTNADVNAGAGNQAAGLNSFLFVDQTSHYIREGVAPRNDDDDI
jgi:hypothetical protein